MRYVVMHKAGTNDEAGVPPPPDAKAPLRGAR
jgi:hypothetical protein